MAAGTWCGVRVGLLLLIFLHKSGLNKKIFHFVCAVQLPHLINCSTCILCGGTSVSLPCAHHFSISKPLLQTNGDGGAPPCQLFLGLYAPVLCWWLRRSGGGTVSFSVLLVSQLIWAVGLGFTSGNLAAFEVEAWMVIDWQSKRRW